MWKGIDPAKPNDYGAIGTLRLRTKVEALIDRIFAFNKHDRRDYTGQGLTSERLSCMLN